MNYDFLKKLEINDEAIGKIIAEHERQLAKYNDYDAIKKSYKEQGEELAKLKKLDPAKLQEQLKTLAESHTTKVTEMEKQYNDNLKKLSVKASLTDAKDKDIITNLLDLSRVEIDKDGNILMGLTEQLEVLKKDKSFLFEDNKQDTKITGTQPHQSTPTRESKPAEGDDVFLNAFMSGAGLEG